MVLLQAGTLWLTVRRSRATTAATEFRALGLTQHTTVASLSVRLAAALAVGLFTASEEYRILAQGCTVFSPEWYERVAIAAGFAAIYAAVAGALLAIALHKAVPTRSWSQSGLNVALSLGFGSTALLSAQFVEVTLQIAAPASAVGASRSLHVALAELASYPNLAGAMLGSFLFLLVCLLLQGLEERRQLARRQPSEG